MPGLCCYGNLTAPCTQADGLYMVSDLWPVKIQDSPIEAHANPSCYHRIGGTLSGDLNTLHSLKSEIQPVCLVTSGNKGLLLP